MSDATRRLLPCGTRAAYVRHLRKGEPACQLCLEGNAGYTRARTGYTPAPVRRRYDIEPLLRVCNGSQDLLAERAGVDRRTVVRWIAEGGVPEPSADRAAVRIGRHPGDLWSEWWDYPGVTS